MLVPITLVEGKEMDISKLNPLNFLGLSRKTEKTEKPEKVAQSSADEYSVQNTQGVGNDSVTISLESLIKKTQVEAKEEMDKVREEKVNQIKEKIASGQYNVSAEELAAAILQGKSGVYEELK
jgi:flagellar biosynthesis anti-sigma factor FlgM